MNLTHCGRHGQLILASLANTRCPIIQLGKLISQQTLIQLGGMLHQVSIQIAEVMWYLLKYIYSDVCVWVWYGVGSE